MLWLEASGLGFDTRLAYYRGRLPVQAAAELVVGRDAHFRNAADAAVYCFDEAVAVEAPARVRLTEYARPDDVTARLGECLTAVPARRVPHARPGGGQEKGPSV